MAELKLNQALAVADLNNIQHKDADRLVRWVADFALDVEGDVINFFFKYGIPGLYPTGEWGFIVSGDLGVIETPTPDPLDHRTSFRFGEIPRYEVKLSSLWGVSCPLTIYEKKLRLNLANPAAIKSYHLTAAALGLKHYFDYISFKIFAGSSSKNTEKRLLNKWINKYIETSNGAQNGYNFYRNEGYGEINLKKVIAKQKITAHALKTRLEAINSEIYKNDKKVTAKVADYVDKKEWIKANLIEESKKSLALYYKIAEQIEEILKIGHFDQKYKGDKTKFEGFDIPTGSEDLVLILNRQEWNAAHRDLNFTNLGSAKIDLGMFNGVQVLFSNYIDKNNAVLMHKQFLQCWILPSETRYTVTPYFTEETTDYVYETMHSLDTVPIYCSMWITVGE